MITTAMSAGYQRIHPRPSGLLRRPAGTCAQDHRGWTLDRWPPGWQCATMRQGKRLAAVAALVFTMSATPASAVDEQATQETGCFNWNNADRYPFYRSGTGWSADTPSGQASLWSGSLTPFSARDAVLLWNGFVAPNGLNVDATETSSTGVKIIWSSAPTGLGDANCTSTTKQIRLHPDMKVDPLSGAAAQRFEGIIIHEVGHTLQLDHVGRKAPLEGTTPAMADCLSPTQLEGVSMTTDDIAGFILHKGGNRNVLPNGGFEMPGVWAWAPQNVTTSQSTTRRTGSHSMRVRRTNTYAALQGGVLVSGPNPQILALDGYFRRDSSTQTGTVGIHLYWQDLTYPLPTGAQCDVWSSGRQENVDPDDGGLLPQLKRIDESAPNGSNWTYLSTTSFTASSSSGRAFVNLIPNLNNADGSAGWVYFDDIRVEVL